MGAAEDDFASVGREVGRKVHILSVRIGEGALVGAIGPHDPDRSGVVAHPVVGDEVAGRRVERPHSFIEKSPMGPIGCAHGDDLMFDHGHNALAARGVGRRILRRSVMGQGVCVSAIGPHHEDIRVERGSAL